MPTYYNGKEIKDTSRISGLSFAGKTSIKIGGRIVTITTTGGGSGGSGGGGGSTPLPYRFVGSSGSSGAQGYPDHEAACFFGSMGGQSEFTLFGVEGVEFLGSTLYDSPQLSKPAEFDGLYFCIDLNASVLLSRGIVSDFIRCGR
jgi:hypothetical protein